MPRPTSTDDLARSLRDALADRRSSVAAPAAAARALLGRLAMTRERPSPAVAGLADALAGAVARALARQDAAAAGSLPSNAALLASLARLRHASLATQELAGAVGRQARGALAEHDRDRLVAAAPAAAAAAAAASLGWAPSGRWLDATLACLTSASSSPSSTPILAAAWADVLDACVGARHAPGVAPAAAAASARVSPSLAARIGAALAALGYDETPALAAALRARVCGGPRGSVAPPAAARAACALGAWGGLDPASAAAALDHVGGDDGGLVVSGPDAAALWAAVRRVELCDLSPRAARALEAVRAAGVAAAAATAAAGPPPGLEELCAWCASACAASAATAPPDGEAGLLWAVVVGGGTLVIEVGPPGDVSSNLPPVRLGRGRALARPGGVVIGWEEVAGWGGRQSDAAAAAAAVGAVADAWRQVGAGSRA